MDDIIAKPMQIRTLKRMLYDHDRRRKRKINNACLTSSVSPVSENSTAFKLQKNNSERKIQSQVQHNNRFEEVKGSRNMKIPNALAMLVDQN